MKKKILMQLNPWVLGFLTSKHCPKDVTGFGVYYWMRLGGHSRNVARTMADVFYTMQEAK